MTDEFQAAGDPFAISSPVVFDIPIEKLPQTLGESALKTVPKKQLVLTGYIDFNHQTFAIRNPVKNFFITKVHFSAYVHTLDTISHIKMYRYDIAQAQLDPVYFISMIPRKASLDSNTLIYTENIDFPTPLYYDCKNGTTNLEINVSDWGLNDWVHVTIYGFEEE